MRISAALACLAAALALLAGPARADEPAGADWLTNLGDAAGSRYSSLDQINHDTVSDLVVKYSVVLGGAVEGAGNFKAISPHSMLVRDGFLYVTDGWGAVNKLDLHDEGRLVWRAMAGEDDLDAWLQANRGLALAADTVISIAAGGRLNWIDDASGEITRSVAVGDALDGYSLGAPPLLVDDLVIVGGSGADRGGPVQFDALDLATGEVRWSTRLGGERGLRGAIAQTGVHDAATGTVFFGVTLPVPGLADEERGLWHGNAVVALDAATGELRWTHHYPDGDGAVEAAPYHLVGASDGGGSVLAHFGSDGRYYAFDAATGNIRLTQDLLGGAAADGSAIPGPPVPGCSNVRSAADFNGAVSIRTGLAYGANANGCHAGALPIVTDTFSAWLGAYYAGADNALGLLSAVEPGTGRVAAQRLFDFPLQAGALPTAGGLVFVTSAEGALHALDDETLETLWSSKFVALSPLPPATFAVDGEQYIAVVVGGNAFDAELSYQPAELGMSEGLMVLVVLGLKEGRP